MITDLLYIASYIKYLYIKIEYLEKNKQKNPLEYNELVEELKKEIKAEKTLLNIKNINRTQIAEMIKELKEIYPFLKNGISITPQTFRTKFQVAIRVMNELLSIEAILLNKEEYERGLGQYLTIDELSLALSLNPQSSMKYHISFLVPDIEQALLHNNFEISQSPMVYNETIKTMYGISDEYHEKYKDKILLYRFKSLLEIIVMASDKEILQDIEYFTTLKNILIAIYSLGSINLLPVLDDIINKYISNNSDTLSQKILIDIINDQKKHEYLKVTFS